MNRALAILAFAALAGFLGILVVEVPSPDLIAVVVLTAVLAGIDLFKSSGNGGKG